MIPLPLESGQKASNGIVAQLGERLIGDQKVRGSNPRSSTKTGS
jgi:hypothetical protein